MVDTEKTAFDKLTAEMGAWKSVEIRSRQDFICHNPQIAKNMVWHAVEEHYIETSDGQRYLEESSMEGPRVMFKTRSYFDGTRCADVGFKPDNPDSQNLVTIKRGFFMESQSEKVDRPIPLLYFYAGKRPLGKCASIARQTPSGNLLNRPCDAWMIEQIRWPAMQDMTFSLDQQTGIPLQVASVLSTSERNQQRPSFTWTADAMDVLNGHPVVTKSHQVEFNPQAPAQPLFTRNFVVKSIEFGKKYPASTFWPVIQPGVGVFDSINDKRYTQPGERAATKASTEPTAFTASSAAVPPGDWSTTISIGSFAFGLMAIVAGVASRLKKA